MDKLHTILQQYSILPQGIVHVTSRLYQIKAGGKQYALKRSKLDDGQVKEWVKTYNLAQEKNLYSIIPIYLTNQNELFVKADNEIYYLTPWIKEGVPSYNKENLERIFSNIGDIHLRTKRYSSLDKAHLEKNFHPYQKKCKQNESLLLHTIERIEKNRYPSPLELQALTHYRDLSHALKTSQGLVDQMMRETDEEAVWGTSLIHGNLEISHCFEQYLINWENASIDHPIHDLVRFFQCEARSYDRHAELILQSFPAYLEENPLNRLESALLCLYLLNTDKYLDFISREKMKERASSSMIDQTIHLEKMYKSIKFGLKFHLQINAFQQRDYTA